LTNLKVSAYAAASSWWLNKISGCLFIQRPKSRRMSEYRPLEASFSPGNITTKPQTKSVGRRSISGSEAQPQESASRTMCSIDENNCIALGAAMRSEDRRLGARFRPRLRIRTWCPSRRIRQQQNGARQVEHAG